MTIEERKKHCRDMLMAIVPNIFRPMADMFIPNPLPDMPESDLLMIEEKLEEACLEEDEVKRAEILVEFVKLNGGSIDFSIIPPEISSMVGLLAK